MKQLGSVEDCPIEGDWGNGIESKGDKQSPSPPKTDLFPRALSEGSAILVSLGALALVLLIIIIIIIRERERDG